MFDFSRLVRAVTDPASIVEDFASGRLHPIAAKVLKDLYPEHFVMIQGWVLENVETVRSWPYGMRIQTGYLFDTNAPHPLLTQINKHQARFAEARAIDEQRGSRQGGTGSVGGSSDLTGPTQLTPAQSLINR
jgi:hypothetical protein